MRLEPTPEEKEKDKKKIEQILSGMFIVKKGVQYYPHNIKRDRRYKLSSNPYYIEPGYKWNGFPAMKLFIQLENIENKFEYVGFQPELLLIGQIENPSYKIFGDVNIALIRFLKLRPMSTNKEVAEFLAHYIGDKEIYMKVDETQPTPGWVGTFNFYTQPSLEEALKMMDNN